MERSEIRIDRNVFPDFVSLNPGYTRYKHCLYLGFR
jgi:hypothetical protein